MSISMIACVSENGVIGYNGDMPWGRDLPSDLQYFKRLTEGHTLIMGRKTFESLGQPLFNRYHIVLTKDRSYQYAHPGVVVSNDMPLTVELACKAKEEVFIIGGQQIFELFMQYADKLYITEIQKEFYGDTYFPVIDKDKWRLDNIKFGKQTDRDKYPFNFLTYERIK